MDYLISHCALAPTKNRSVSTQYHRRLPQQLSIHSLLPLMILINVRKKLPVYKQRVLYGHLCRFYLLRRFTTFFAPVKRLCNTDATKREMILKSNTIIINTAADFVAINFASGIIPSEFNFQM